MKFDVDDKNRCRLVCVKFHLNRCRFAVAVAKCLGGSLFGTQCSSLLLLCTEISSVGSQPDYKNPTASANDYRNRGIWSSGQSLY